MAILAARFTPMMNDPDWAPCAPLAFLQAAAEGSKAKAVSSPVDAFDRKSREAEARE
jgi:hypothetical protein